MPGRSEKLSVRCTTEVYQYVVVLGNGKPANGFDELVRRAQAHDAALRERASRAASSPPSAPSDASELAMARTIKPAFDRWNRPRYSDEANLAWLTGRYDLDPIDAARVLEVLRGGMT